MFDESHKQPLTRGSCHHPRSKNKPTNRLTDHVITDNRLEAQTQNNLQLMANNFSVNSARLSSISPEGLPSPLKTRMENHTGTTLDHVRVYPNSPKPAVLQAHAFAQGSDIHLGPGQEKHLPHELGHVVQQMKGMVSPTGKHGDVAINDDQGLEKHADELGAKAMNRQSEPAYGFVTDTPGVVGSKKPVAQCAKFPVTEKDKKIIDFGNDSISLQTLLVAYNNIPDVDQKNRLKKLAEINAHPWVSNRKIDNSWVASIRAHIEKEQWSLKNPRIENEERKCSIGNVDLYIRDGDAFTNKGPAKSALKDAGLDKASKNFDEKLLKIFGNVSVSVLEEHNDFSEVTMKDVTGKWWVKTKDVNVTGRKGLEDTYYGPSMHPLLFAQGGPTVDEVEQGQLGDCYLLAALISIVKTSPDEIRNIIQEVSPGRYKVNMFEVDASGDEHKHTRVSVEMNAEVPVNKHGEAVFAKGALWVQLIEKGYAMLGFSGSSYKKSDKTNATYGTIKGGFASVAAEHLLGRAMITTPIKSQSLVNRFNKEKVGEDDTFSFGKIFGISAKAYTEQWSGFDQAGMNEDKDAIKKYMPIYDTLLKEVASKSDKNYQGEPRLEDLIAVRNNDQLKDLKPELKNKIENAYRNEKLLPGKRGMSIYSQSQLEYFDSIVKQIDENKIVGLGSKEETGRKLNVKPKQTGNEPGVRKGIPGGHGYSVLDYGYGPEKSKEKPSEEKVSRWLRIRNPWRSTEREYEKHESEKLKAREVKKNGGVFWVELSDVTKRFARIYHE